MCAAGFFKAQGGFHGMEVKGIDDRLRPLADDGAGGFIYPYCPRFRDLFDWKNDLKHDGSK